ncbi:UNVERIFIED_CONTAM: hypothetical protein HDU68_010991 [Siphonaria sp. JEL0065]|nr:hypothetical protein HDU68_010991 [Siphonaria sp. JEL0065]
MAAVLNIDIFRCLGGHSLLAPSLSDLGTKERNAAAHELSGSPVPTKDSTAAAVEAYFSSDHPLGVLSYSLLDGENVDLIFTTASLKNGRLAAVKEDLANAIKTEQDGMFQLYASILLARISLLMGDYKQVISSLNDWVFLVDSSRRRKLDVLLDGGLGMYGRVVYLMAVTVLGQAFLASKYTEQASKCFHHALEFIDRKLYIPPSATSISHPELRKLVQNISQDQWIAWQEESFYSLIGLVAQLNDHARLIQLSKQYTLLLSQVPTSFRPEKRASVLRLLLTTLATHPESAPQANLTPTPPQKQSTPSSTPVGSTILYPFATHSPFSGIPLTQIIYPPQISNSVVLDFQTFLPMYESLVLQACNFPRLAGGEDVEKERMLAWRHARVVELFEWWGMVEYCVVDGNLGVGGVGASGGVWDSVERGYRVVEIMYRGTKHTFQNLKILRHLSHAFVSLLGHLCDSASDLEVDEAFLAVQAYVDLYMKRRNEAIADAKKHHVSFAGVVEGEGVGDAVGVLINGVRLALTWFRGDDELLNTPRRYIDFALELLQTQNVLGNPSKELNAMFQQVYKYKGIVYGELAADVTDSADRRSFQDIAVAALKESIEHRDPNQSEHDARNDWQLFYQLALQLGEMGEVSDAVMAIQESLTLNSSNVASWNLLALLLTSLRQYAQAYEVCDAGWKEGVDSAPVKASVADISVDGSEGIVIWESVPVKVKEDLFNLKLTQLAVVAKLHGPKAALEALQPLFSLFSRMFNSLLKSLDPTNAVSSPVTPVAYSYASSEASYSNTSPYFQRHDRMPSGTAPPSIEQRHSRKATDVSSVNATAGGRTPTDAAVLSSCPPFFGYSFRLYDLQICLWTTVAKIYTQLKFFVDANLALTEAETLSKTWIILDQRVRGRESLLFKGSGGVESDGFVDRSEVAIPLPRKVTMLKKGARTASATPVVKTGSAVEGVDVDKRWGVADSSLRRVLADVNFGVCFSFYLAISFICVVQNALLKEAKYLAAQEPENLASYSKYLPEISEKGPQDKFVSPRRNSFHSTFTINHSISQNSLRPGSIKGSANSLATNSLDSPDRPSLQAGIQRGGSPASSIAPPVRPPTVPEEPPITIDMIIDDLHVCLALDNEHVPSRVELARMYQLKSIETLAEAEYWFERTCRRSKMRGSGSGSRGLSTHFGGLTSEYGVECWAGLGTIMRETATLNVRDGQPVHDEGSVDVGRLNGAKECLYFAVEKERTIAVRGFQCLSRTFD